VDSDELAKLVACGLVIPDQVPSHLRRHRAHRICQVAYLIEVNAHRARLITAPTSNMRARCSRATSSARSKQASTSMTRDAVCLSSIIGSLSFAMSSSSPRMCQASASCQSTEAMALLLVGTVSHDSWTDAVFGQHSTYDRTSSR